MKTLVVFMLGLAFVDCAFPQQRGAPIPPGIRKADQLPGPADVPPMGASSGTGATAMAMRDQAHELAELAETIPEDVFHVSKGTLPKDLSEKLKRIEKLSKTLRGEVSH